MWLWVVLALVGLAFGGVAVARLGHHRGRGAALLAVAAGSALVIEALIRFGAISVDQGTDVMSMVVLVLMAIAATLVSRPGAA